jgi:hypothetical protein
MSAKTKPTRRTDIPRPYNGGEWTKARFVSFVKSALRGARWPQKYKCIERAFVKHGINPVTGRKCKLCRCEHCKDLFPQTSLQADHIEPVVGPTGFTTWDDFIRRLFVEADGFKALCRACHHKVTTEERNTRKMRVNEGGVV